MIEIRTAWYIICDHGGCDRKFYTNAGETDLLTRAEDYGWDVTTHTVSSQLSPNGKRQAHYCHEHKS